MGFSIWEAQLRGVSSQLSSRSNSQLPLSLSSLPKNPPPKISTFSRVSSSTLPLMENSALLSSKFPVLAGSPNPSLILSRQLPACPSLRGVGGGKRQRFVVSAIRSGGKEGDSRRISKNERENFARISSSSSSEMSTASATPQLPVPPPPSYIGSPLLWIGVGVGISALFSVVATKVKQYAMQQAFKAMMGQSAPQGGQFSNATFPQGSPFQFPPKPPSGSSTPSPSFSSSPSPSRVSSQAAVTVDVPATEVEASSPTEVGDEPQIRKEQKKYAFVDVSPDEVLQKDSGYSVDSVSPNGAATKQDANASSDHSQSGKEPSLLSVEALEKMMEDPNVQKMVYPYLPEEMRNPTTFKWMLQNPEYRRQLQDMLSNMGGSGEWDSRMMDSLKNFDLSSPEVKQQFDQIGLTPEEVISKIMANPEVAMAFQNPKVQAAIMDCSQNPLSIAKYQNDKEVMDVFTKISELFPGVTGP
ncbi:uncharacterized protein A4U43_C09F3080 [Asparagus officinalis]|uniref:Protein TIC 40, chloroplastic n=1 Tax=Asparagus officinalis TaxID=4686 RepID=A0A5P1E4X9_ASPOF|nr:protein TIC 40, chloroplastic-like [Asparagus officinalis]ONK57691.1 uncharacterized protein A4U43_C09F3080 [Asparagus officinalis]